MLTDNKQAKRKEYDTSFYSIRRAQPNDLPQIIDVIISEPYFRWKELIQLMLSNIYVTVTWFVGALTVIGFAVATLAISEKDLYNLSQRRAFYIILSIFAAVSIFGGCFMKAFSLYFVRYIRAFEIRSELQKMDQETLKDNALILKNKQIHLFWKMYNFYIAEPYDQPSKKLILGIISLSSYSDYCREKQISDKDFEVHVRAVPDGFKLVTHKTIVVSWLVVNEKFFKNGESRNSDNNLRDGIYHGLLQYVGTNVVKDTSINYVVVESDDFVYWQHDILMDNKYGFCGERVDLIWDFYYQIAKEGFPNTKYFFIKICNIDELTFKKALKKQNDEQKTELI